MTQQVFADFLQQSPATLSSIFNGRTRPTLNIVEAIKSKIPDISTEWLLFGVGDMHVSRTEPDVESPVPSQGVPTEARINFDSSSSQHAPTYSSRAPVHVFQNGVKTTLSDCAREEIKIIDKSPRKVTEIRVYYDDQTYETFVPAKK